MEERWKFNLMFKLRLVAFFPFLCLLLHPNLEFCWSLNDEGVALLRFRERLVGDPYDALSNWSSIGGEENPCLWFGVKCSDGRVVALNLKDLCLEGTLAPELGILLHIKSIVLRNNSFSGIIPKEFGELKDLEELDLGYNNLSGLLPSNFGSNLSLAILLLDHNRLLGHRKAVVRTIHQAGKASSRRLLQGPVAPSPEARSAPRMERRQRRNNPGFLPEVPVVSAPLPSPSSSPLGSPSSSPFGSPFPLPSLAPSPLSSPSASPTITILPPPPDTPIVVTAPPPTSPSHLGKQSYWGKNRGRWLLYGSIVVSALLFILSLVVIICRSNKVVVVRPWATGLSGQLQKAFVTGVPKLKRSELETACEDFSNIIESSSEGKMYKGTLSSGVEIAVTSTTVVSAKDWTRHLEAQFRRKIDTLSKVNHKNFVNLLGFCEENEPFTRMMVFEYAPNGTLFEHLHIKEAEHLEWGARLRIAMGVAYCLDHMHKLNPPVIHKSLNSTAIYLTEDYAAKISDFSFWNGAAIANTGFHNKQHLETPSSDKESNIYSFGLILLEMITGRLPYTPESGQLADWASDFFRRNQPVRDMVDPILKTVDEDKLLRLCEVIVPCIHPDPKQRPTMTEVTTELREITAVGPDAATPRLSPLWWAEIEILSAASN